MGLKSLSKCLVASALAALSAPALAQDRSGLNIEEFATGERGGVAQFNLAQQLYAMGVKNQEALLVVTAARLASGVQMRQISRLMTLPPRSMRPPCWPWHGIWPAKTKT